METNGDNFGFLADFVSEEIMQEFFGYQQQQASGTASESNPYGGGVAEMASGGHSSSIVEIERLIGKNNNPNTAKSTKNWISKYAKWAADNQLETDLTEIPEDEVDGILQRFYAEIRKNNGENYEPESLKVMQALLDRYLREKGRTFSILKDRKFDISRRVLNGKAIELQENGMGKRKKRADALT